jgi:2-dehydro-3-deoxy-D-arabinonate dehydratase
MRLARVRTNEGTTGVAVLAEDGSARLLDLTGSQSISSLADLLHSADPTAGANRLLEAGASELAQGSYRCLAPIDCQEVWAAGVTYKRSQVARMEESESAATHYDKVYTADRPELFLKATPHRVAGPGDPVRVRADSDWTVPEPEFVLVISPDLRLVGYSIGNDVSARDIEGENPLYLPQAKCYREAAGLGPCVLLADGPLDRPGTEIQIEIERGGETVFGGTTNLDRMARTFEDLIDWLGRENVFPEGVLLMTGTGIVPPDEFTLQDGDTVSISITGIGNLTNPVVKDPA